MKIVWICSFGNSEIQQIIGSQKNIFASPWITELIDLFRDKNDIDLTIISPNYYSNSLESFKLGNIQVFLTKYRRSFIPYRAYNLSYNYNTAKKEIEKIVNNLRPDLIHLHGSENAFYASSILNLSKKYPVLVNIQGFIFLSSKPKNLISQFIRWNRIRYERKINSLASNFIISSANDIEIIQKFNKKATHFMNYYPTVVPLYSATNYQEKKYDLVYYARITKSKGIEDLIVALYKLKKLDYNLKTIIIGGGSDNYINQVKELIQKYQLTNAITFAGFQSSQQDVFKLACQAKIYVLPTHFDALPGTVREAMYMKIPVIANAVGGIPTLNNVNECITLVEKKNIDDLVNKIILVLKDEVRTQKLVENAYNLIIEKFDNSKIYANLLKIYDTVLNPIKSQKNE